MKSKHLITILIGIITLALILVINGCGKGSSDKGASQKTTSRGQETDSHQHGMSGEGLAFVHTADALYTCPMHPEVVTDKPNATCPSCKMNLTKMSDEAVAKLRESNPKGCAMCSIVVPGDSEMTKCPKCNMDLVETKGGGHKH